LAVPLPIEVPEQVSLLYSVIVADGSLVPWKLGVKLRDGEGGTVLVNAGAAGAVESSTYVNAAEHGDVLPAVSRAVAVNDVVVSSATGTAIPGLESVADEPVAADPVQFASVKIVTVVPASALPTITGLLLFAGEFGVTDVSDGAAGPIVSGASFVGESVARHTPSWHSKPGGHASFGPH
jgi:hypothetical protein